MFRIKAAELTIDLDTRFNYAERQCGDYIVPREGPADLTVAVTREELKAEMEKAPELFFGDGYGEVVVLYEKISNALPAFEAFVLHASVVAVDGKAYAFAAPSGTGKSTHTRYWKEVLGDRVTVINGDKPICRFRGEELIAYGTPWCGKEGWQTNAGAPLKALCLLERSEENSVTPADGFEQLGTLMQHFHLPGQGQVDMPALMELIDRMLDRVPVYKLRCTNDVAAARTAVRALLGEECKEETGV